MRFVRCFVCGARLEAKSSKRTFCSDACRMRAYRRRKQGIPETFIRDGVRAGGRTTLRQRKERIQRILQMIEAGIEVTPFDYRL